MSMREFERSLDSLNAMFAFTRETFSKESIDERLHPVVDLALEELFTNVVKYATETRSRVRVDVGKVPNGVEVTLTDHDVDFFDVTRTADVDINAPRGAHPVGWDFTSSRRWWILRVPVSGGKPHQPHHVSLHRAGTAPQARGTRTCSHRTRRNGHVLVADASMRRSAGRAGFSTS